MHMERFCYLFLNGKNDETHKLLYKSNFRNCCFKVQKKRVFNKLYCLNLKIKKINNF